MTDTELREALVDLAAFILYALENGKNDNMDERDIFATVGHDVNGLIHRLQPLQAMRRNPHLSVNPDEFFVPRSAGYGKEFKPGAKEAPPF